MPRAFGAFAAGRIANPKTATSQLLGDMIRDISAALHEATEIDKRAARYVNTDLAEYLIPVNATFATSTSSWSRRRMTTSTRWASMGSASWGMSA